MSEPSPPTTGRQRLLAFLLAGARRDTSGRLDRLLMPYAALVAVGVIYAAGFAIIDPLLLGALFVTAMLPLVFLTISPTPLSAGRPPTVFDWAASLLCLGAFVHFYLNGSELVRRISMLDPLSTWDLLFGTVMFVLTLEATRRSVGPGLTLVVSLFVAYIFWGHLLSGPLHHGYIPYQHFLDQMVFTTNGIFGVPIRVAATYAFLFVMFGTFLHLSGGGDFYFDLASALAGRRTGGPAKIAVISSAMYGTLSGSPTSDVVTTGSITIPVMKRLGYSGVFAGAVETVASTGGSILPPVMGSAAFMMAELTGIPYVKIAFASLLPALLYYYGVYLQVHYRSERRQLVGLPADQLPRLGNTIRSGGLFMVPLAVLVTALYYGYSPTYVGLVATVSVVAVAYVRRATRPSVVKLYATLAETTMRMVPITAACAAAGLVIGGITMTGLGGKFSRLIFSLTGESLLLTLIMVALLVILLGMGMPTPSAYILAAVLVGPILIQLNIEPLPGHLFLIYFASMSAITPPVAVAAYAAASIAGDNPIRIAFTACRLGIVVFVVPFIFIFNQALLLQGGAAAVAQAVITAVAGTTALAAAAEGWFRGHLLWWERLLLLAGGLMMMVPEGATDLVGLVLAVAGLGRQLLAWRRTAAARRAA